MLVPSAKKAFTFSPGQSWRAKKVFAGLWHNSLSFGAKLVSVDFFYQGGLRF
jgi:hypothetical protein